MSEGQFTKKHYVFLGAVGKSTIIGTVFITNFVSSASKVCSRGRSFEFTKRFSKAKESDKILFEEQVQTNCSCVL